MPIICGIYRITSPTNAIYIGQSVEISERISAYKNLRCKQQFKLYNSIKKYGWHSHKLDIIHECPREELNKWEIFYIDLYNSFDTPLGLNLDTGGRSNFQRSQSTKDKIKAKRKLQVITEETRAKMSAFQKNRPRKRETYEKISRALTGKKLSPERIEKTRLKKLNVPLSEQHKKNIGLAHLGMKRPESTGLKISAVKKSKNLISSKHHGSKKIIQFTRNDEFVREWACSVDPQRELGYHGSHINACCRGVRKTSNNFKWSYA